MVSHRIQLIGEGKHEEGRANAAITPGHLVQLMSTGKWRANASSAVACQKAFALEDALQGRTIDTAYAENELVAIGIQGPGDVVLAWADSGENIVVGDLLESAGNGNLQKYTTAGAAIAVALEAMDLNDTGDVTTRFRVRIL